MSITEVELTAARQLPTAYERARRRQMKQFSYRPAAVAYLAPGRSLINYAPAGSRRAADHHAPEWPVAVPAYRYARGQLARVAADHIEAGLEPPSDVAYHKMLHVLRSVLAEDSVFPTMSIDDEGGVIAEWRVASYALEIDVDPDGQFSFTVRKDGKRVASANSQTPLRKLIRDFSAVVAQVNPNWRALFPHTSAPIAR